MKRGSFVRSNFFFFFTSSGLCAFLAYVRKVSFLFQKNKPTFYEKAVCLVAFFFVYDAWRMHA